LQHADLYELIDHLSENQAQRIRTVSKEIQLIADLGYCDIVIYCLNSSREIASDNGEVEIKAIAAAKPNTSTSVHPDNVVGQKISDPNEAIVRAIATGKRTSGEAGIVNDVPVKITAVPIKDESGSIIAIMTSERREPEDLRPSEMEQMYMGAANDLIEMIEAGVDVGMNFPSAKEAGDGLLRIDLDGIITYLSPNAVSVYRRLGVEDSLAGRSIHEIGLDETPAASALEDRKAVMEEITERGVTVIKRAIPLIGKRGVKGVVAIIRDVTDVRAREQQLKIKEATIREIHHRVKNNLQTIASLLRLQARRMTTPEARQALLESVGRISSIAVVHEILSGSGTENVDFKEIATNINSMIRSGLVDPGKRINIVTRGVGGQIPSPVATALALVLTELVQNAVEHAFVGRSEGKIVTSLERRSKFFTMTVSDDGNGLPENFNVMQNSNLGLQIVHTLVSDELGGTWEMSGNGGTKVTVRLSVDKMHEQGQELV
jgi:two-component sensor histidine kinase